MAFGQPERTCLNIQNIPILENHADLVNPKFGQSGVYQKADDRKPFKSNLNWLKIAIY